MTASSVLMIIVWLMASLFIVLFAVLGVDPVFRLYYSNILQTLAPVVSALFCYRTATVFPTGNPMRKVWGLLGTGMLAWGIGAALYSSYPLLHDGAETPYPYYSDIGYLSLVPLVIAALLLFKSTLGIVSPPWGKLLAFLLFLGGLYISVTANWEGLFKGGVIFPLVSAAYILSDPILLMVVMLIVSGLYGGAAGDAWWYIMAALVLYFIGNQSYTYLVFTKQYASGSSIDSFWVIAFGLVAVAAMITHAMFKGNR